MIEKDYFATETLRVLAGAVGGKIIFKGGTGLSKGRNLIQRFSEEVAIFTARQNTHGHAASPPKRGASGRGGAWRRSASGCRLSAGLLDC